MRSLRVKLLLLFTLILAAVLGAVGFLVSHSTVRSFHRFNEQRTAVLVEQFRREFDRRGADVLARVEGIAASETALRLALELSRGGDTARFVRSAGELAEAHGLEVVILAGEQGEIISSAHYPARFGYREEWLVRHATAEGAFLQRLEFPPAALPEAQAVTLLGARTLRAGNAALRVLGGRRLDREFLTSLTLPAGMRALLYTGGASWDPAALLATGGAVADAEKLQPLLRQMQQGGAASGSLLVHWENDAARGELFHALPLRGRGGELLAVLLLGSSQRELVEAQRQVQTVVVVVAVAGLLLAMLLSGWAARPITRPLEELAVAAGEVASGNWQARVEAAGGPDEVGRLAAAFNAMTAELVSQRERLVQAERVAAWRELARRLAHELKNPLFPLQITVENMLRARRHAPQEFDEVFRESAATLLAELGNLKQIVARFSDFARMPAPRLQPVFVNQLMLQAARLAHAHPQPVEVRSEFEESLSEMQADPDLLYRAIQNLVLNALDAMPEGGTLTLRTRRQQGNVLLEVADSGPGLSAEECERLFTPYYTTRQQGTGLGLAIVQSVVSDHGGRVAVESTPGHGATFRITLPMRGRGAAGASAGTSQ